jgi:hypothetical protein
LKRGGGRNHANEYRLNIPAKNDDRDDTVSARDGAVTVENSDNADQKTVTTLSRNSDRTVTPFPLKTPLNESYEQGAAERAAAPDGAARRLGDEEALKATDGNVVPLAEKVRARSKAPDPAVLELAWEIITQANHDDVWSRDLDPGDTTAVKAVVKRLPGRDELERRDRFLREGRNGFTPTDCAKIDFAIDVIERARKKRTVAEYAIGAPSPDGTAKAGRG